MKKILLFIISGMALFLSISIVSACNGEVDEHSGSTPAGSEGNFGGMSSMMTGYASGGMMQGLGISGGMMPGFGWGIWSFLSLLLAVGLVILVWLAVIQLWRNAFHGERRKR